MPAYQTLTNIDRPCPFCGSKAVHIKVRKTAIIECAEPECGAMFIRMTAGAAIEAWNRRAPMRHHLR